MKRRICCFALAFLLIMGLKVPVSAAFDTESRESVVVVAVCLDMNVGTELLGWGTGFFVGVRGEDPGYLVTNYHVISDFIEYNAGDLINVTLPDGSVLSGRSKIRVYYDASDYEEAYLVDSDGQKDVAVLRLDKPTGKRKPLPLCSPDDSMVGSTIYAIGYPGLADNNVAGSTTSWGVSDCTVTTGSISRMFTTEGTGVRNIQIDCEIKHGNSGGPLINEYGAVLGINTWGVSDGSESFKYAVSIDEAIPMLKLHSIDYELVDSGSTSEPDPDPNPTPDSNLVPNPYPNPVPDSNTSSGLYIIIGVLAVIIIAAVVVILMMRKKKPSSENIPVPTPSPGPSSPAPQPARTPVVRTVSGMSLQASLSPQGQPLFIGRNQTTCSLVFPNNTPGVSGRHCSLSWDNVSACFILTDLQSTYGTYLENGQKLAPGVACRLRSGERFYLGEKNNMLSVGLE